MKTVYPDFAEDVDFYAVGFDGSEDLDQLNTYTQNHGYPWPVAVSTDIVRDLGVTQQAYKIAIDGRGVQIYRASYGSSDTDEWREVFTQLSGG